ncbi:HAD family acid phosphatase [Mycoplasmopsis opalescens]|uniref:HAD family acid phosphatase n=1 Tax=Mycoplasmopsis opalescens TaxID=114886 RepID=UPI0004A776A6|nr:HAD family acid phosphatase [Mycoplasmopsis opalescens]
MSKKLRFLITGLAPVTMIPALAISCKNDKQQQEQTPTQEQKITLETLEAEVKKLSTEQKVKLIQSLNLTNEEKGKLIQAVNKGAGITSAIVWYMTSAEQRLAATQAYTLATVAFDNLKTKWASQDNIDYGKVDKDSGKVSNPDSDKAVPVVFMDIDETVLVNEYSESNLVLNDNGKFVEEHKDAVDAKGNRRAVPGAIEFINHVFENGGIVMFNSGIRQLEASVKGIKANLIKLGVKQQYVQDWMFWCSGVDPVDKEGKSPDKTPWKTAIEKFNDPANQNKLKELGKVTSKNQRMNAVSENTEGWNFGASQEGSGDKVVTKVIMRVGDDFNDFYDDAYKHLKSNKANNDWLDQNEKAKKLFTDINGSMGIIVKKKDKVVTVTDATWHQFNVQVPGNAMYGGWTREHSYGAFDKLWEALQKIQKESKDATEAK